MSHDKNPPAHEIFEVAIVYRAGIRYLVTMAFWNLVLQDMSYLPQDVVIRYRDSEIVVYKEYYNDPVSASYAVEMLTEELQTKTVQEFCKDRSLDLDQ